jgi:hypothetical protein
MRVLQIISEKEYKKADHARGKDPMPKKSKPGKGPETAHPLRGKLVGEEIAEAPFSDLGTGLKKFGAKAAAKLGAKDTAASMAGDVDRKERSNLIYRRWLSTAASANLDKNQVDAQTLANFMGKQGLPTDMLKTINKPLQDKQVANIIAKAVAQTFDPSAGAAPAAAGDKKNAKADPKKDGNAQPEVKVDPAMQKQIDALSPEQKKELAALL